MGESDGLNQHIRSNPFSLDSDNDNYIYKNWRKPIPCLKLSPTGSKGRVKLKIKHIRKNRITIPHLGRYIVLELRYGSKGMFFARGKAEGKKVRICPQYRDWWQAASPSGDSSILCTTTYEDPLEHLRGVSDTEYHFLVLAQDKCGFSGRPTPHEVDTSSIGICRSERAESVAFGLARVYSGTVQSPGPGTYILSIGDSNFAVVRHKEGSFIARVEACDDIRTTTGKIPLTALANVEKYIK